MAGRKAFGETPMDFEWQNGTGNQDVTSPFSQLSVSNTAGQKRAFLQPIPPSRKLSPPDKKTTGGFDTSAPKPQPPVSSFFGASTPAGTPFRNPAFTAVKNANATPFRTPNFTTPRKPFDADMYNSEASGAETSPGMAADNEDTPETRTNTKMFSAIKPISKKPLFGRYGDVLSNSPKAGEIRRPKYETQIAARVQKRRRTARERDQIISTSARSSFDSDKDRPNLHNASSNPAPKMGMLEYVLSYINAHPNLPDALMKYMQLGLNIFLVSILMWIIWEFIGAIKAEIEMERMKVVDKISEEIAKCVQDYTENRCARDTRLPALEGPCRAWEACFDQDPERVGRARVSAATFSTILNSFVDGFSYKTMVFVLGGICAFVIASNVGFSAAREKYTAPAPPQPSFSRQFQPNPMEPQQWGFVPMTPARRIMDGHGYGTPGMGRMGGGVDMTPGRQLRGEMQGGLDNDLGFMSIMPSQTPRASPRKRM